MQSSIEAKEITELSKKETFNADIFGPLAFDNSISKKSAAIKGIKNEEFVEWEKIHGDYYYGTSKAQIEKSINKEISILLELDVKGAISIQKLYPNQTISIFVEPPSLNELKLRLKKRGFDSKERIEKMKRVEEVIDDEIDS